MQILHELHKQVLHGFVNGSNTTFIMLNWRQSSDSKLHVGQASCNLPNFLIRRTLRSRESFIWKRSHRVINLSPPCSTTNQHSEQTKKVSVVNNQGWTKTHIVYREFINDWQSRSYPFGCEDSLLIHCMKSNQPSVIATDINQRTWMLVCELEINTFNN